MICKFEIVDPNDLHFDSFDDFLDFGDPDGYYDFFRFQSGRGRVKIEGKWGYINGNGDLVVRPKFDSARSFSEGLAEVSIDDKWGYIDNDGNWVIEPIFDGTDSFSDGLAMVKIQGKWGYINAIHLKFTRMDKVVLDIIGN